MDRRFHAAGAGLISDGASSPNTGLRGPFGPDDIALGIVLTGNGPEGWMFFRHPGVGRAGPLPAELVQITRDENKKTLITA